MTLDVIRGDRRHGQAEGAADGLRDVAGRYALFRDGVQAGARRSLREPESDKARGVGPTKTRMSVPSAASRAERLMH